MPLYTRSDLVESIIRGDDTTAQDYIISYLDELAVVSNEEKSSYAIETIAVDSTNTQYIVLTEDMDDSTNEIQFEIIDEFDFERQKGVVLIDSEEIIFDNYIQDGTSFTFVECTRGYNSTTPAAHLIDTTGEILYYLSETINEYWQQTITPADSTGVEAWKILYYETVYNQALRSRQGLVITDSNSPNYPIPDWDSLVDNITTSGGLSYNNGDWIKYEFPDTVQLDRLTLCIDSSANFYFAWSPNDTDWTYVGAEADHTLTSSSKLVTAANQSAAATNYWAATEGSGTANTARFPVGVRSKYVKIFLLSDVTIYDMVYTYVDVKDSLAVDYLSAISADVGLLTAGVIESSNFDDGGVQFDLDNDVLKVYDAAGTLRVKLGKLS